MKTSDPNVIKRNMHGAFDKFYRALALEATKRIVLRTPVGNPDLWKGPAPKGYVGGRARANWHFSIGSMDAEVTEDTDKSGAVTIAIAQAKIPGLKMGDTAWIANGLPYIRRLENGWSKQSPGGMVRLVQAELQPVADQIAAKVRNE